jgi:hypothetical protein
MKSVQTLLVNVLREVAHPDGGVIAKVRSSKNSAPPEHDCKSTTD